MAGTLDVVASGALGGLLGGLSGFLIAKYNARTARATKLMELEFQMYWDLIGQAQELVEELNPFEWPGKSGAEVDYLHIKREEMKRRLLVLDGQAKAVQAYQQLDTEMDQFEETLHEKVRSYSDHIPPDVTQEWLALRTLLVQFQVQVRHVLRNPHA